MDPRALFCRFGVQYSPKEALLPTLCSLQQIAVWLPIMMKSPDLRILALADTKLLPPEVQAPFDHWRIWKARDAVVHAVRKRLLSLSVSALPTVQTYLDRLQHADTEETIFEGIYALAEVVEVYRQQLGTHSEHLVLIMSGQLNPWGLLAFQRDFEKPASSINEAAEELWRLARATGVDVDGLLTRIKNDPTLAALDQYYTAFEQAQERQARLSALADPNEILRKKLIQQLYEAHRMTLVATRVLDPNTLISPENNWRVRDFIGHLADWDTEALKSLRAYRDGQTYQITDDGYTSGDDFNLRRYQQRQEMRTEQIYQEWAAARNFLKTAILEMPIDKFGDQMRCPWGALDTISHLIEELVKHEQEHRDQILQKIGPSVPSDKK